MPSVITGDFDCFYLADFFGIPWEPAEVVLIQHGNSRTVGFWSSWVPDLAKTYRVVRRDMRAHGRSYQSGTRY